MIFWQSATRRWSSWQATPSCTGQRSALDALLDECVSGVLASLDEAVFDHAVWAASGCDYFGRSWFAAPLLWAEAFFCQWLLDAVGYFAPGPWQGVDPFAPFKRAELWRPAVGEGLAALGTIPEPQVLLRCSLWGIRAGPGGAEE